MSSVTFERFRGLNLADDPGEVGGETAIACSNVEFDTRGRLRTRRGYAAFSTPTDVDWVTASGNFLLAAGQDSNTITIFRIDQTSGKLTYTGKSLQAFKPVCLRFLPNK